MSKTKFQTSWQQNRPWLVPFKSNVCLVRCTACNSSLNVVSGVGVIQRHEKVDKHLKRLNDVNSQATFASSGQNFFTKRGNTKVVLTSEQQVWNAVIDRALNVVENNISFNLCDEDNDLYRRMSPDSNIAKNYCQGRGKVKYVIQFGISPYIRELVQSDLQGQPFTFYFDETTKVMRCAIWYHLYNLKNVKNTHRGVLILVSLQLY